MRIIDADAYAAELWKLRENYQMLDDTHTADKIMHGIFRAEQALKEQPTVDAVPIDFIKALHADYVQRSKALQGRTGYMYTLYAIALENLVQSFDYDNAMADEMKTERNCADVERKI